MWKNWNGQAVLSFTHNHQPTSECALRARSALNKCFFLFFLIWVQERKNIAHNALQRV